MRGKWCRGLLPLSCGVLLAAAAPALAAVVPPAVVERGTVIVTAETADVREGPSHTAEVITVVERGEIFEKQGRTRGWYCIRLGEGDDALGWVSGRAIRRYRPAGEKAPAVRVYDGPSEPYPWGGYYPYSYYLWGEPTITWERYYYYSDGDRHRDYSREYRRDHDRDRPTGTYRRWEGGGRLHRDDGDRGSGHAPRLPGPRLRR